MINVLFLVMEFAPVNTTGNFRSLKFVKYLKDFGINPIVVTLKEGEAASIFNARISNDLLNDIPEGTSIYRIGIGPVKKTYKNKIEEFTNIYFSVIDGIGKAWKENLLKEIDAIMQMHLPEIIYTSLPPFSSGLLAKGISEKYKIPFIVDMRDLWAYWGSNPNGSYAHFAVKKFMERKVFEGADKIIGVTPQLIEIFRKTHPQINHNKFEWIPNGYDNDLAEKSENLILRGDRFIIGYVGSFYYSPTAHENAIRPWWRRKGHKKLQYFPMKENWLYRSPYFFFKALDFLLKKHPELRNVVRFDFIGIEPDWMAEMLSSFNLSDIYCYHGFLSHKETLEVQNSFNAFLATSEKVEGGEHYCLPSKIFDYVQKQKPILAFVTTGVQKTFLKEAGLTIMCDPDDSFGSAIKIKDLIDGKFNIELNRQYIQQYHRKSIAEKLSNVFKIVAGNSVRGSFSK